MTSLQNKSSKCFEPIKTEPPKQISDECSNGSGQEALFRNESDENHSRDRDNILYHLIPLYASCGQNVPGLEKDLIETEMRWRFSNYPLKFLWHLRLQTDSGSSGRKVVGVQVPVGAPKTKNTSRRCFFVFVSFSYRWNSQSDA
jgi:hypothetical protein